MEVLVDSLDRQTEKQKACLFVPFYCVFSLFNSQKAILSIEFLAKKKMVRRSASTREAFVSHHIEDDEDDYEDNCDYCRQFGCRGECDDEEMELRIKEEKEKRRLVQEKRDRALKVAKETTDECLSCLEKGDIKKFALFYGDNLKYLFHDKICDVFWKDHSSAKNINTLLGLGVRVCRPMEFFQCGSWTTSRELSRRTSLINR